METTIMGHIRVILGLYWEVLLSSEDMGDERVSSLLSLLLPFLFLLLPETS